MRPGRGPSPFVAGADPLGPIHPVPCCPSDPPPLSVRENPRERFASSEVMDVGRLPSTWSTHPRTKGVRGQDQRTPDSASSEWWRGTGRGETIHVDPPPGNDRKCERNR
eukprot:scaffold324_cov326-Pavlova_lutheri.AAC.46